MRLLSVLIVAFATVFTLIAYIVGTLATNVACALNQGLEEPSGKGNM